MPAGPWQAEGLPLEQVLGVPRWGWGTELLSLPSAALAGGAEAPPLTSTHAQNHAGSISGFAT